MNQNTTPVSDNYNNSAYSSEDLEYEDAVFVANFQYYVEGVGIIVTGSIGLVINIFALYILFRKQVSNIWSLIG